MACSIVLGAVLLCTTFAAAEVHLHPLSDEFIALINSEQNSWTAGRNFPTDTSMARLSMLMGALQDDISTLPVKKHESKVIASLPEAFDTREKWPHCSSMNEIRDQGCCGSGWAFGAVAAMTDRVCISSNGTKNFHFSAQDVLSCCFYCSLGCELGGFPKRVWQYWAVEGIVSGGAKSSEGCMPYEIKSSRPCKHIEQTPVCTNKCATGYNYTYVQDKHYAKDRSIYTIHGEADMKAELFLHGPIEATFDAYTDLLNYKNGVYFRQTGHLAGNHAVKILGWGVEKGQKYWLAANSWNSKWGDKGFFKILRGTNECNIEHTAYAGIPQ